MKSNERLIKALNRTVELKPDIELGKFIRYIGSVSDLAYMSDDDIAIQIEYANRMAIEYSHLYDDIYFSTNPIDISYGDRCYDMECAEAKLYNFSKENEQIAYDRYKDKIKDKIFFEMEERLSCDKFLKRFELAFVDANDYKNINLINHCTQFWSSFPNDYRHMNFYGVARKNDKYLAFHSYACKIPCFGELFVSATVGLSIPVSHTYNVGFIEPVYESGWSNFDEIFVVVIDWAESPRFTDYTNHIQYGVCSRPKKKELEVYSINQTIEIFHELMQKSNKITSTWEGVLYDDGSFVL